MLVLGMGESPQQRRDLNKIIARAAVGRGELGKGLYIRYGARTTYRRGLLYVRFGGGQLYLWWWSAVPLAERTNMLCGRPVQARRNGEALHQRTWSGALRRIQLGYLSAAWAQLTYMIAASR